MVSNGRCGAANGVGVLLFDCQALAVHLFHEAGIRLLAGAMGRHVLDLLMHFLEHPERRLVQQLRCHVVQ